MDVDTRTVPARERLDYWHDSVCDRFVPLLATPASRELHGRIRSTEIAQTKARRIAGTEHKFERRVRDIRRGGDPEALNLVFVNRGTTVVEQDRRTATLGPGDYLFYDSARPFEFISRGAFDYMILMMPKHQLGLPDDVYHHGTARPQSAREGIGAVARRLVGSLVSYSTTDSDGERDRALQESLLAALASLVPTAPAPPPATTLVALAKTHVERHFSDPRLTPAAVAEACGISVSYLHLLFASEDQTVGAFIREERLQAALRRLTSRGRRHESIAQIGRACGFEDPAHFSRVVRNRFDASPRDLRRGTSRPVGT